jgi:hypothetical protein
MPSCRLPHARALAAALALPVLAACAGTAPPRVAPMLARGYAVDTIVIAPITLGAYAGSTIPLSAELWQRGDTLPTRDVPVHWSSDRVERAWVAEGGTLVLLEPGKVTLTAQYATLRSRLVVEVRPSPAASVTLASDAGSRVVYAGDTVRFHATVQGEEKQPVLDARVHYAVASRGLRHVEGATVDAEGRLVARHPGVYTVVAASGRVAATATILVSAREGAYAASSPSVPVRRVEIADVDFEPFVGTAFPLRAEVWTPEGRAGADAAPVVWTSSDPAIALVDEHGTVAFRGTGRVTIAAEAGGKRATRKFNVRRDAGAHMALTINRGDLRVGDSVRLTEEVWQMGGMPIRDARVNFAVVGHGGSADPASVTISEDRVFVARAPGIYTIIAELGGLAEQTTLVVRPRTMAVRER